MREQDRIMIDAVIRKAERVCPDSIALIGLYGSAASGDLHKKSDLDLLILINDDNGWQLSEAFILDDIQVGYDLYCTNWAMLESDAECNHAYLSKLLDAKVVYVKDEHAAKKLAKLKEKALAMLASAEMKEKAQAVFENAKKMYADCCMAEDLSQARVFAGAALYYLTQAIMLNQGQYFRKGVKHTLEEMEQLPLSFDVREMTMSVIRSESVDKLQKSLKRLMCSAREYFQIKKEKATPTKENISGTYEEMFSNWRNKMYEASERNDLYSSFMNMLSFDAMFREINEHVDIGEFEMMSRFRPGDLAQNAKVFDDVMKDYLNVYKRAGLTPVHYENVQEFVRYYIGEDEN